MITQWDIISSIRPKDNAISYALLIDGTEHDARLIFKKLQGYAQAPQPALAPYVYRFALPDDLDEDTLEKIRVAVREGIEQAKKVNEFVPGGPLGNPLFNSHTDKEDKEFPTFITLDPSESFFRSARQDEAPVAPAKPEIDQFEQKQIDLASPEEEIPQIAKTLEEIDQEGYRSDLPQETASNEEKKPQSVTEIKLKNKGNFISFRHQDTPEVPVSEEEATTPVLSAQEELIDMPVQQTAAPQAPAAPQEEPEQSLPEPAEPETEPAEADGLTSVESDDFWSDQPPISETDKAPCILGKKEDIDLQVQAVSGAEQLPQDMLPAGPDTPATDTTRPTADPDLPLSDRDMLIKDMEGTMLGQSLDDIFLAETKYDMFVDLDNLPQKQNPLPPKKEEPKQENKQDPVAKGVLPDAAAAEPLASTQKMQTAGTAEKEEKPETEKTDTETASFNIFDQKIKDQTSFIDLEDIANITERITQKDLSFLQHAQIQKEKEQTPPDSLQKGPLSDVDISLDKTRAYMPLPSSFGRFEEQTQEDQEVMDPFEQLLAASKEKKPLQEEVRTVPPKEELPDASMAKAVPQAPQDLAKAPLLEPAEDTSSPEADVPAPAESQTESDPVIKESLEPEPAQNFDTDTDRLVAVNAEDSEEQGTPATTDYQAQRENRVIPPPTPITEKKMPENNGEKKPIFRIKRKPQPQAPAAPQAPQPPQAPAAPQAPQPHAPAAPQMPAEPAAAAEAPQEEKHGATILRRRQRPAGTFLEKTRTIDHSIELPLSELKKHNWPLEVPLVPTYTLENMTISINRFAHATAISVIDNPGKLYNPLVLHGASGTGKTHFLHAIGYALSNKYGQENIFITNGVRLSRGIQRYVMEGNMDKFESFVSSVKALLIDDIHLIAINEQNRVHLSKLLNDFRKQQKQIVITSKYPPESLAKLEELLNFKLDSGWISDLKPASGPARTRIIQKMLNSNGIDITNEDINRFFGHPNMSLGTVSRAIRRVRVLEKLIFPNEAKEKRSATAIFDQLLATTGEDQHSLIAQKFPDEVNSAPVAGNGEWGRIGFFYPQNHSNMMNWLVFALQQRAKELGIPGGPELAVRSSYSTENIISSAFKIANLCDNKKLKGAVILGPETENCEPSVRENFYDILTHMLEIMLIRCGVINYENVCAPSTYVKILSELLR